MDFPECVAELETANVFLPILIARPRRDYAILHLAYTHRADSPIRRGRIVAKSGLEQE